MADQFLFEIDASKLIAKLHLAAVQSLRIEQGKGEFIANTGIVDDDIKATPDNPGKVSFDLTNNLKAYQVGYAVPITYYKQYGIEEKLKAVKDAYQKAIGKDSKIDAKLSSKEQKDYEAVKKDFVASLPKDLGIDEGSDVFNTDSGLKSLDKTIESLQKKNEDSFNEALNTAKQRAYDQILEYLTVFAGKENVQSFNKEELGYVYVGAGVKDGNDKSLIDNFEFQDAPDTEKQKQIAKFRENAEKDPGKPNCQQCICLYVNYTLDVDK